MTFIGKLIRGRLARRREPIPELQRKLDTAIERGRAIYEQDGSWEAALGTLRAEGYGMAEAQKATYSVLGVSFHEARQIVLDSATWEDRREATIAANETLWAVLKEDADEFTDDGVTMTATFDLTKRRQDSEPD